MISKGRGELNIPPPLFINCTWFESSIYTVYRGIRRYLKLEVVKFKLLFFLLSLSLNSSIQHFTRNIQTLDRQNEYKSEIYKTVE